MIRYITGGLSIFFLLVLFIFLLKLYLESRQEIQASDRVTGEEIPADLREAALRPLRQLGKYYEKRDPEQADSCIDETMLPDKMLILGTNPWEVFQGRDGATNLLQGDWKYWGLLSVAAEETDLFRVGSVIYFVTRGCIKLDRIMFRIPIEMTGVLEEKDGRWFISKLKFVNELNTNYVIIAWIPAVCCAASLLLLGLSFLFHI